MPIADFNGETFVAFTDISGFKELMKDDMRALGAIRNFYQIGFDVLQERSNVEGFFVSDCGILFSRIGNNNEKMNDLLLAVKDINCRMLSLNYMLTTSIAFGHFNYQGKIEVPGIEKNPIYGGAYVLAFLDNEKGRTKIQPGQCRIIKKNLPDLNLNDSFKLREIGNYFYYYWNVDTEDEIESFEKKYRDSYSLKFSGMLKALKNE